MTHPSAQHPATAGTSVLVVDDSSTIRRILRRDLEGAGYRVSEASDGEAALALCRQAAPDVVLLDIDMPVLNGLATLERMQQDADLRDVPVLFLTAHTSGDDAALGLELGAHDYLKKPCTSSELLARVGSVARQRAREKLLTSRARELTQLSTTDPLTSLLNRRGLEELLAGYEGDRSLAVLMVDLDLFKRINDTEGHLVGDAVLAAVAALLRSSCSTSGTVSRWGGEEFVVVADLGSTDAVAALAERLRSDLEANPLEVGPGRRLPVTASIGAALGTAADFAGLLHAADTAVYEAKAGGRNRVAVAPA